MVASILIFNIIIFTLLFIILVWIAIRWIKKFRYKFKIKKQNANIIPQDVLNDFEELERRIKTSRGNQTPEQIMWEYAKERNTREVNLNGNKITDAVSTQTSGDSRGSSIEQRKRYPGLREASTRVQQSNEVVRGDGKLFRGEGIQVQPNRNNTKDKRKPKIDWTNFS